MNNDQLNRLLRLIQITNDKAIVVDAATDEMVVMLPLDLYESMIDSNSNGLLAGQEREAANDLTSDSGDQITLDDTGDDDLSDLDFLDNDRSSDFHSPFLPIEPMAEAELHSRFSIPRQRLNFAEDWAPLSTLSALESEENLDDVPHDEEEEKFYLEPVE